MLEEPGSLDLLMIVVNIEHSCMMRSYHPENSRSHQNTELKPDWACLVLTWVTSGESQVTHCIAVSFARPRQHDRFVLVGLCWLYGRSELPPPPPSLILPGNPLSVLVSQQGLHGIINSCVRQRMSSPHHQQMTCRSL